jgi:hypothetical protein
VPEITAQIPHLEVVGDVTRNAMDTFLLAMLESAGDARICWRCSNLLAMLEIDERGTAARALTTDQHGRVRDWRDHWPRAPRPGARPVIENCSRIAGTRRTCINSGWPGGCEPPGPP